MADTTVESMAKCKKVLENIYMLADDLKNSVEENEEELSQKLISKSSNMFYAGAHLLLPFLHIFYDKKYLHYCNI